MAPFHEGDNGMTSESEKRKRVVDLTASDDESAPPSNKRTIQETRFRPELNTISSSSLPPGSHSLDERRSWLADDDGNENEILASSQYSDDSDQLHLYGDLPTKIVGVQYYRGYSNPGERILMRREPGNPYDSNAIRVDNVAAQQIGHIPRRVAEKLAKYMDERSLRLEGELAGHIGQFDVPLTVHMYGPHPSSNEGIRLQQRMQGDKLPIKALKEAEREAKRRQKERHQAEKQHLAESRKAAAKGQSLSILPDATSSSWAGQASQGTGITDMTDLVEASQRISPRNMLQNENAGLSEEMLKSLPLASQPEAIRTEMLPYQLQALRWMLDQESPKKPETDASTQLWQHGRDGRFTNLATTFSTQNPTFASGGILADDMGLGKTLEMIALIAADNAQYGRRSSTLVVAPLGVLSNWQGQASVHVKKEHKLNVYTYHAGGRQKMKATDFAQYDIVLTTYGTLASDFMPSGKGSTQPVRQLRSSGLYSMEWVRVILDEGHTVRNPQTKGAAAVNGLFARSKWVLTGTPIVNSLKDLYSLLKFIGITGGLEQLDIFNSVLVRPLKNGSASASHLLQAVMRAFVLRRRKDMSFIDLRLPKLDEYVHTVDFTAKERERYDALDAEAKGVLKTFESRSAAGKGSADAYNSLLEILLRMRQTCNHWHLCKERVENLLAQLGNRKTVELTTENKKALQDLLQVQIDCSEDCPVCLELLSGSGEHKGVITTCGHVFGESCIQKVVEGQHRCPMCRAELKDEACLVGPKNDFGDEGALDDLDPTQSSSKLEGLLKILGASKGSGDKAVVFSQWTSFLDIVEARLDREGYKSCRIDGTMSAQKRDSALQALEKDDATTVMLASLGVCAVGLNLTAASTVVLCDTWWAPAIEDQAIDRVHRLGQKKETRVFRLVVNNSIEESVLSVQQDKRKLAMLAFSESEEQNKRTAARSRIADIQRLLA